MNFCDTVETGLTAPSTGTYTIAIVGGGNYADVDFTIGQSISFTNIFNENMVTVFQVQKPNGDLMEATDGSTCFSIEVTSGANQTTNAENMASNYKVYTALLTQTGTNAPTATVLENTLGGTVVWTREDVGSYVGTLNDAFTAAKTLPYSLISGQQSYDYIIYGNRIAGDQYHVFTDSYSTATPTDISSINDVVFIEIRVYY